MGCAASTQQGISSSAPNVPPDPEPEVPAKGTAGQAQTTGDEPAVVPTVAVNGAPAVPLQVEPPKQIRPIAVKKHDVPKKVNGDNTMTIDDVFAWLRWSPEMSSPCAKTVSRCFPGALPVTPIVRRTMELLQSMDSSINDKTVLYGQSICPDEINNDRAGLSAKMIDTWGNVVFPMGGIGGVPFVGKTGFGAFSHHVPDDGHVFILFGPHMAVSAEGELGKYHRVGQTCASSACGAVLAAYNACKAGEVDPYVMDMSDMQQTWLRQRVHACYPEIAASDEPLQTLITKTYKEIEKTMLQMVNHDFGNGKLILLGGIQLNLPHPYDDHFQPLMFRVSSQADPSGVDLLPELYHSTHMHNLNLGNMTKTPKANSQSQRPSAFAEDE